MNYKLPFTSGHKYHCAPSLDTCSLSPVAGHENYLASSTCVQVFAQHVCAATLLLLNLRWCGSPIASMNVKSVIRT